MFHLPIRLPTTFLRMLYAGCVQPKGSKQVPAGYHHGIMVKGLWFDLWLSFMVYLHVRLGLWLDYGNGTTKHVRFMVGFICMLDKQTHTVETLKLPTSLAVLSFMLCWTRPSKAIFGLFFKRLWTYFLKLKSGKIKTPQWVHTEGVCNYCGWLKTTCLFNPWRFSVLGPTCLQHLRHFGGKFHPDFVDQNAPVGHQSWFANQHTHTTLGGNTL
jgi:hypothetical protein